MSGSTTFSDRVLSKLINQAAASVPGVEEITSSWADLGTRSYPRNDIRMDSSSNTVHVDSYIAVTWPSPIADIAEKVQDSIVDWVRTMTGMDVTRVNVAVEQTVAQGSRVTAAAVGTASTAPVLRDIHTDEGVEVVSPTVDTPVAVVSPQTAESVDVFSPYIQPATTLAPINVADGVDLSAITTAPESPLRPVTQPPAVSVESPAVAKPIALRPVTVPPQISLMKVHEPARITVARPRVPREQPLARITVRRQAPVISVSAPSTATAPRIPVRIPPEQPLKPIVVKPLTEVRRVYSR